MKRIILTIITCICCMVTNAQNTRVELNLDGVRDSTKILIRVGAMHKVQNPLAEAFVKNGKALLKFNSDGPRLYYINADNAYGLIAFVCDKGNDVKISANVSVDDSRDKPLYRFSDVNILGTSLNKEYITRNVDKEAIDAIYKDSRRQFGTFLRKLHMTKRGSLEQDSLMKTPEGRAFAKAEHNFISFLDSTITEKVLKEKDSWWGPLLLLDNMPYIGSEQAPIFNQFSKEAQESFYGKVAHDLIFPKTIIGETVPDFVFTDYTTKKKTSLKEQLASNKYVILDFWASWCGPCMKEIPNFKRIHDLYSGKGLQIISISADANENDWLKALTGNNKRWLNDLDRDGSICKLYKVEYYPTIYLIDSEGKIVAKDLRGNPLADLLARLFK